MYFRKFVSLFIALVIAVSGVTMVFADTPQRKISNAGRK